MCTSYKAKSTGTFTKAFLQTWKKGSDSTMQAKQKPQKHTGPGNSFISKNLKVKDKPGKEKNISNREPEEDTSGSISIYVKH
jgi:hypothetical protein